MSEDPKTFAEQLDAAQTREEIVAVIQGLFRAVEVAKDEETA